MTEFTGMSTLMPGYRALVIGSSGGIGKAFVSALEADGACHEVVSLSRSADGLDVTDDEKVAMAAQLQMQADRRFDLIVCATGALVINGHGPEKTIKAIDAQVMARQFALNAIGPALLMKHFSPLMATQGKSIFAVLSARVGSMGDNRLGGWISYRSSKAALNQIVRTSSIEIARMRPQSVVVSLHPGSVDTGFSGGFSKAHDRLSPPQSVAMMLGVLNSLAPTQSGGFFAYDGQEIEW